MFNPHNFIIIKLNLQIELDCSMFPIIFCPFLKCSVPKVAGTDGANFIANGEENTAYLSTLTHVFTAIIFYIWTC